MNEELPYVDAEKRLKQLNAERKVLKERVLSERETRLKEAAEMRVIRDKKIEEIRERLNLVLDEIFQYNKLGKVEKDKHDILGLITKLVENPLNEEVTAMAEAERLNHD